VYIDDTEKAPRNYDDGEFVAGNDEEYAVILVDVLKPVQSDFA